MWVVPFLMWRKRMSRASVCDGNPRFARHSHSSMEKELSGMALWYASPREPIEGRTPSVWKRCPNAYALY